MNTSYVNQENERIEIIKLKAPEDLEGMHVLVIHDDPPPTGTGVMAPHLLDQGTIRWLKDVLEKL